MIRRILLVATTTWLLNGIALGAELPLVPRPQTVSISNRGVAIPDVLTLSSSKDELWTAHLRMFAQHCQRIAGVATCTVENFDSSPFIAIVRNNDLERAAYRIRVTQKGIQVEASSLKGLSHATATLLQLVALSQTSQLNELEIQDAPASGYRNFMVDMGRNPHSIQLLRETIDLLWFYKVDSLQLHLTDDQRFAFPSTAFPKLWDGKISLEEFRALERYALVRGVTIIPELEVPGHSSILRNRYPDVFGQNAEALTKQGSAIRGIETLLDEMIEVFGSSPYIHIGGDEAYGVPEELQRGLINHLHAFLKSKGRKTIVWEGPRPGRGENKVNTEVIHINWRTINYPADQMLRDGYPVVNAAWDPLYLVDHYPRTNFTMTSPQHLYETLSLTQFKHVNPGIPTYANPITVEPSDRLIGYCMPWWEGREENYFPQIVPRLIPFAEIAWHPTVERDYAAFAKQTSRTESTRRSVFYPLKLVAENLLVASDGVFREEAVVDIQTRIWAGPGEIRYTLDGSEPNTNSDAWNGSMKFTESIQLRAAYFLNGNQIGHGSRLNLSKAAFETNLALDRPVTSSVSSGAPFSVERITDGETNNLAFYLGYPADPEPVEITIDLGQATLISRVVVHAYTISNSFEKYEVEISDDGSTFNQVANRMEKPEKTAPRVEHQFTPREARYVRIKSHGNKGYVFDSFSKITEVQVFAQ